MAFYLSKLESSSHKDYFMPSLVELSAAVLDEKILKFHQCFFDKLSLSLLGKWHDPLYE